MTQIFNKLPEGVKAEWYEITNKNTSATFEANSLKQLQSTIQKGYALRVIKDGRVGFAAGTKGDADELIQKALRSARYSKKVTYTFPSQKIEANVASYSEAVASLSESKMVETGERVISAIQQYHPDFLCAANISKRTKVVKVINNLGGEGANSLTTFAVRGGGELVKENDILNIFAGANSGDLDFDLVDVIDATFGLYRKSMGQIATMGNGQLPVIFTPKALLGTLFRPLAAAFNGKSVLRGSSPLADKLGEQVFADSITIWDDATVNYGPASTGIDDEGVVTQRLPLVKNGVVNNFIYDLHTAAQAGVQTTGNGYKRSATSGMSIDTLPQPVFSNVIMGTGNVSLKDMIAGLDEGIIIDQISGPPNFAIDGDFSVAVLLGYKVENGSITGRIKNVMASGNAFTALKNVLAVGKQSFWSGTIKLPHLLIDNIRVTTK